MLLETGRLFITEWRREDWVAFRPIASDPEVMRYIGTGEPWPDARIEHFVNIQIERFAAYGFCLWKLTEKATDRLIGFCGLQRLSGTEEIESGWWLARMYWGKDLATEAGRVVLRHAFEILGLRRVVAIAQPQNGASLRVMQKLGMQYERDWVRDGIPVVLYAIANPDATHLMSAKSQGKDCDHNCTG